MSAYKDILDTARAQRVSEVAVIGDRPMAYRNSAHILAKIDASLKELAQIEKDKIAITHYIWTPTTGVMQFIVAVD